MKRCREKDKFFLAEIRKNFRGEFIAISEFLHQGKKESVMIPCGSRCHGWRSFARVLDGLLYPLHVKTSKSGAILVSPGSSVVGREVRGLSGSSSISPGSFVDKKRSFVDIVKTKVDVATKDVSHGCLGSCEGVLAVPGSSKDALKKSLTKCGSPVVKHSLFPVVRKNAMHGSKENAIGENLEANIIGFRFKKSLRVDFNSFGLRHFYWVLTRICKC